MNQQSEQVLESPAL